MAKPITNEMLQTMTLVQLKTLRKNAEAIDTPAAREVLDLLAQSGLLKTAEPAAKKKASPTPSTKPKRRAKPVAKPASKVIRASYGRQA